MDTSLIFRFLPRFIVSAIVSYFIFRSIMDYRYPIKLHYSTPEQSAKKRLLRISSMIYGKGRETRDASSPVNSSPFNPIVLSEDMRYLSAAFTSTASWVILTVALSGTQSASFFFPVFSTAINHLAYSVLAIVMALSIISGVSANLANRRTLRIISLGLVPVITIVSFFLPATIWIVHMRFQLIILVALLYVTAFFTTIFAYIFWWKLKQKLVFQISMLTSILAYIYVVILMVFNGVSIYL